MFQLLPHCFCYSTSDFGRSSLLATDSRGRDTNPFEEPEAFPDSNMSVDDMRRQQQQIIAGISHSLPQLFIGVCYQCVSFRVLGDIPAEDLSRILRDL